MAMEEMNKWQSMPGSWKISERRTWESCTNNLTNHDEWSNSHTQSIDYKGLIISLQLEIVYFVVYIYSYRYW